MNECCDSMYCVYIVKNAKNIPEISLIIANYSCEKRRSRISNSLASLTKLANIDAVLLRVAINTRKSLTTTLFHAI